MYSYTRQPVSRRLFWRDIFLFLLILVMGIFLLLRGDSQIGYQWHWQRVLPALIIFEDNTWYPGPLFDGLKVTVEITLVSLIGAALIGFSTAILRLSGTIVGMWLARIYLELIRNTPLLVQIFFLYFVMAPVFGLDRFTASVLALSLFEGAYVAEIVRAGITSIDKGQWEAAGSLGMRMNTIYMKVILPQAIRRIIPPLTSQAISLIKDSALVSTIAVYDLTMEGRAIIAETFLTFEIWFTVAAIYLLINVSLSCLVGWLEKRYSPPHH